jgi:hypothetical protein
MQVIVQCDVFTSLSPISPPISSSTSSSSTTSTSSLIINTFHIIEQSISNTSVLIEKISSIINAKLDKDIRMKDIDIDNISITEGKQVMTSSSANLLTSSSAILMLLWCVRLSCGEIDKILSNEELVIYKSMIHEFYCNINYLSSNLISISNDLIELYDQILVIFDSLWCCVSNKQQISILTIEYLYELSSVYDLISMVLVITSNVDLVNVELQPRVLFIIAWLLRSFNIDANTSSNISTLSIPNNINSNNNINNNINNSVNNLKEIGVGFITSIGSELSLLIDRNQGNSSLPINEITSVSMKEKHLLGSYVQGSLRLKLEEYAQVCHIYILYIFYILYICYIFYNYLYLL